MIKVIDYFTDFLTVKEKKELLFDAVVLSYNIIIEDNSAVKELLNSFYPTLDLSINKLNTNCYFKFREVLGEYDQRFILISFNTKSIHRDYISFEVELHLLEQFVEKYNLKKDYAPLAHLD